jgi:hypothetical protein
MSSSLPEECFTSLTHNAAIGATQIEVASTVGCSPGDELMIGTEAVTIAGIASIMLTTPLKLAHKAGEQVTEASEEIPIPMGETRSIPMGSEIVEENEDEVVIQTHISKSLGNSYPGHISKSKSLGNSLPSSLPVGVGAGSLSAPEEGDEIETPEDVDELANQPNQPDQLAPGQVSQQVEPVRSLLLTTAEPQRPLQYGVGAGVPVGTTLTLEPVELTPPEIMTTVTELRAVKTLLPATTGTVLTATTGTMTTSPPATTGTVLTATTGTMTTSPPATTGTVMTATTGTMTTPMPATTGTVLQTTMTVTVLRTVSTTMTVTELHTVPLVASSPASVPVVASTPASVPGVGVSPPSRPVVGASPASVPVVAASAALAQAKPAAKTITKIVKVHRRVPVPRSQKSSAAAKATVAAASRQEATVPNPLKFLEEE